MEPGSAGGGGTAGGRGRSVFCLCQMFVFPALLLSGLPSSRPALLLQSAAELLLSVLSCAGAIQSKQRTNCGHSGQEGRRGGGKEKDKKRKVRNKRPLAERDCALSVGPICRETATASGDHRQLRVERTGAIQNGTQGAK